MGIHHFISWIKETYPFSVQQIKKTNYDHVYIDLNVILHRVLGKAETEGDIIYLLCSYIDDIIARNIPTKSLTLAADGIAPLAKIMLQKKRRMDVALDASNDNINNISSLMFTAGTKFMKYLESRMSDYIKKTKNAHFIEIIQLLTNDGEAEIKLANQIVTNSLNKKDTHCVLSTDADVILILASINVRNVYFNDYANLINIDIMLNSHIKKVYKNIKNLNICYVGLDFCFVSLLLGNDYLQKLGYINISNLWKSYCESFFLLNTTSNYKYLVEYDKKKELFMINNSMMITFSRCIVKYIPRWYTIFKFHDYDIKNYHNYVVGILWCLNMYSGSAYFKFNYMSSMVSIHPIGLLYYIDSHYYCNNINNIDDILKDKNDYGINSEIYATIIMPKCYRHLIFYTKHFDFTEKLIFDKISLLYEIEQCAICKTFITNIKKNINNTTELLIQRKQYNIHKKTHKLITSNDVIDIVKFLKQNGKVKNFPQISDTIKIDDYIDLVTIPKFVKRKVNNNYMF